MLFQGSFSVRAAAGSAKAEKLSDGGGGGASRADRGGGGGGSRGVGSGARDGDALDIELTVRADGSSAGAAGGGASPAVLLDGAKRLRQELELLVGLEARLPR